MRQTRPFAVSPLDLPQRSYTDAGEKADETSTLLELQKQRQREQRMRETAAQFTGEPLDEDQSDVEESSSSRSASATPRGEISRTETIIESTDEISLAEQLVAQQAVEEAAIQAEEESLALQQEAEEEARIAEDGARASKKNLEELKTMVAGASSPSGVGFAWFMARLDAALINHLTFKNYDLIPKPSWTQIAVTILIHLFALFMMFFWVFFYIAIAILLIAPYALIGYAIFGT